MSQTLATKIKAANSTLMADGNLEKVGEFFAPDYVAHVTDEDLPLGHGGLRKFIAMVRSAFPDLRVEVEILVEGTDRVAWLKTLRGTHQGAFKGFPASGQPMVWREMVVSQFRDGLIAEEWFITDLAERFLLARKGAR